MEKNHDEKIKDVLKKYPELAEVLKEYDINCHNCEGNCSAKSIFEEHNLSMKEEISLVKKMKKVIEK